jgi:glycosyltransferase involved in cell wall biosynthesis
VTAFSQDGTRPISEVIDARVVFLTHYIPLYQVRVLQEIAASVRDFKILVSTPIEPNRDFQIDWSGLDVTVQKTWTVHQRWKHREGGFDDPLFVHIPRDTYQRLRDLKPDVVMSLELGARSVGAAIYCHRHPEAKLVLCTYMSERTEKGRGLLRNFVRTRLIRKADALTYNGESCLKYLQRFTNCTEKMFHLPYAADDRTLYHGPVDRSAETTRQRLLVVGQLSQRKGVLAMLQQVAGYCRQRPNRRVELVFAGDGPLRSQLEALPLPANLQVNILGCLPPAELSKWMVSSGALIAPTLADEWMLVVNEALHAGLPVIGSVYAQAVTSVIRNGINGWQYDPLDSRALGPVLDAYFGEPDEGIQAMCENARASIAERTPRWAASGALNAIRHVLKLKKKCDVDVPVHETTLVRPSINAERFENVSTMGSGTGYVS